MTTLIPDTHDRIKRLTSAGLEEAIAEEIVRQSTPIIYDQISTKTDIELIRRDIEQLRKDIEQLRGDTQKDISLVRREIEQLRADTQKDIEQLRLEMKKEFELVRKDIEKLSSDLTIKLGLIIIGASGLILGTLGFVGGLFG